MARLCPRPAIDDDRGQLVPLFAAVFVVALAVCLAALRVGAAANDRARAQTAADMTSLAAAAADDAEASAVARANGAEVVAIDRAGNDVTVEVRVGDAAARASAERTPPAVNTSTAGTAGLHPDLLAAIARAEALIGRTLHVTSGLRTRSEQEELWRNRHANPYPVARPGTSDHERGLAVDVAVSDLAVLVPIAARAGLCRPLPTRDPVHFRLCAEP